MLEDGLRAARSLRRAPAHSLISMALLATGIASAAAVLSVGDALIRRPLPVERDAELVVPYGSRGDDKRLSASAFELEAWRQAPSLDGFAATLPGASTLEVDDTPTRIASAQVEPGYFQVLGVVAAAGRLFDDADARSGARLTVVGFGLWQRLLGGEASAIGSTVRIDGESWEVIGVLPPGFDLPYRAEIWTPLDVPGIPAESRSSRIYDPVARLAAGRTLDDLRAELALIARRLETERPDTNLGWTARAISLRRHLMGDPDGKVERSAVVTFWGALLLLLIASANVSQLQVVRAALRSHDMGLRLSLGASRGALARMIALETLILVAVAALVALPLAWLLATALLRLGPASTTAFSSHLLSISLDPQVLLAIAAIIGLAGIATGIGPAWRASRSDAALLLGSGTRATGPRSRRRLFEGAVLIQVAVAVALLATTLALAESYGLLRRLDVGFRPEGATYYELSLSPVDYAEPERRGAFVEALVESVSGIEGARRVAVTSNLPLQAANWIARYGCEGRVLEPGETLLAADRFVTPGYVAALGLRLVSGRTLLPSDRYGAEPVVVVNQSLADDCWPGRDPIGLTVERLSRAGSRALRVVGVVADARELRVSFRTPHTSWYLPYDQQRPLRPLYLLVRGDVRPADVRDRVHRLDPHQPIAGPLLLADLVDEMTGSDRMAATVMAYFTLLGVLLVGVGVYGSMERYVTQQRRSIGIRMAFGAEASRMAGHVFRRSLGLALLGAGIGTAGAVALQRLTAGFVFGVVLSTPLRLAVTALGVLALALVAGAVPAVHASRVEPAELLRE